MGLAFTRSGGQKIGVMEPNVAVPNVDGVLREFLLTAIRTFM